MYGNDQQERIQFEGNQSESDTREQDTRTDTNNARGDMIENDNDNFKGLGLREDVVLNIDEME